MKHAMKQIKLGPNGICSKIISKARGNGIACAVYSEDDIGVRGVQHSAIRKPQYVDTEMKAWSFKSTFLLCLQWLKRSLT